MAISNDKNRETYSGDGSSASFSFSHEFHAEEELAVFIWNSSRVEGSSFVYVKEQQLNTDYTISGTQDAQGRFTNGANVVFNSTPATGDEISIFGSAAILSHLTQRYGQQISSQDWIKAMDRLLIIEKRLNDLAQRAVRLNDAYPLTFDSEMIPFFAKNAPIIINSTGLGIEFGVVSNSGNVVTSHFGILPVSNGGLGAAISPDPYTMLYADSQFTYAPTNAGTNGQPMVATGSSAPQFQALDLANPNAVQSSLPVAHGGTNNSSFNKFHVLFMNSSGTQISGVDPGTNGRILASNGSAAPTFQSFEVPSVQSSHPLVEGQAATTLDGESLNSASFSSAYYNAEIIRGSTVVSNGFLALQFVNGSSRVVAGGFLANEPHGVTFDVTQSSTIATMTAAADSTGKGDGTIKLSRRRWNV